MFPNFSNYGYSWAASNRLGIVSAIGSLGQPTLFLLALGFGLGPTFARLLHADKGGGAWLSFLTTLGL
jgi:hypothetical protein